MRLVCPTGAAAGHRAEAAARTGAIAPSSRPMKPCGVQPTSPTVPPGRHTEPARRQPIWWCGANITPTQERHHVERGVVEGHRLGVGLARLHLDAGAGWRPPAPDLEDSGVRSEATTRAPVAAAGIAAFPEPAATSSTVWPARTPLAWTSTAPRSGITVRATRG